MRFAVCFLTLSLPAVASAQAAVPWANRLFSSTEHDFGKVARDAKLTHTFTMTNIYDTTLSVTEIRSNCGCSSATVSKKTLKPKESADLVVTLDGAKVDGPKHARIFVKVGPEFVSEAALTILAEPLFDIKIAPRVLDLGLVTRGGVVNKMVEMNHPTDRNWKVVGVVKPEKVPLTVALGQNMDEKGRTIYQLNVTFKADVPPGSFRHEVVVKTNDKIHPTISFPVLANVERTLTLTPEHLKIDEEMKVGATTTRKFVVRGERAFRLLKAEGLGEGVAIDLPDKEAALHILEVRVQPGKVGSLRREITLRTSLGGEFVVLLLEGTAIK